MAVKTKIIATIGPASSNKTILRKMFSAGLDIARLNFSHGSSAEHVQRIKLLRALNSQMRRSVKIMQDLEGHRIRLGRINGDIRLKKNAFIYLTQEDILGNDKEVGFDYNGSLKAISSGNSIYIDDGKIILRVSLREKRRLKAKVIVPGTLKGRKGINIPDARLSFEPLTQKDKLDLNIAIKERLDYVAQSFVNSRKDVSIIKDILSAANAGCKVFAKVESRDAVKNIDEIIDEADGIIIARGDMGICLPIYKVPIYQKEIIKKCRLRGKFVIVATQMLESMVENLIPTRAEVSDVANAIFDGASGVMLSAETAVGKNPSEVIAMMNKIIKSSEEYMLAARLC